MAQRTIPVITSIPELTQWRTALKKKIKKVVAPAVPWNFQVVSKQGGNYLTWAAVTDADGYEVDISTSGDFVSDVVTVSLTSPSQTAYFDSTPTSNGATPAARSYRVRATAGTITEPHSVKGINSGAVRSTAIAPNDTVTAPTTTADTTTTDRTQAGSSRGNYREFSEL